MSKNPFRYFNTPPEIIRLAVMMYVRFPLSLRNVEDLLHEGEVLGCFVTRRRDRKAALRFSTKAMKRYGNPEVIVTDRLASYRAAMNVIGNQDRQETARWANDRAENFHLPFRRRERSMLRFGQMRSLQKFVSG